MEGVKATCRSCEVIFLSDSSGSGEEKSHRAAAGKRKTRTCAKIAPVFLRTTQRSRTKRSRDAELNEPRVQRAAVPPPAIVSTDQGAAVVEVVVSPRRGQPCPSAPHTRLQEVRTSHLNSLQRKEASERLQGDASQELLRDKKKRGSDTSPRETKHLRTHLGQAGDGAVGTGRCQPSVQEVQSWAVPLVTKQPRSSRLSHSHRLKKRSGTPAGLMNDWELKSGQITHQTESDNHTPKGSESKERVSDVEETLWTDKYGPQHSSEVIGNSASVAKLQSWLKKWKLRADRDERRRRMEEKKREENSHYSWDCGDFQGEAGSDGDGEETLCNTVLLTGPPGVGKTASLYACAQELGFKVFEVNCSSQRSGRHVLSQLKEATQSHLVETPGNDALKPAYISNSNTSSCTSKAQTLPGKLTLPKNVNSFPRKRATCKLSRSVCKVKTTPPTVTLARYFKTKAKADHFHLGGPSPSADKTPDHSSLGSDQTRPQNKKSATSLILFEEVDVIFDDDVGFLAAIKAFMATTKRPVVLTTNDPTFRTRFHCSLEEIVFKPPSAVRVCSYLQFVCLAEHVRVDSEEILGLVRLTRGDVRRCLMQLQLWVKGGEGSQSGSSSKEIIHLQRGDSSDSQLHPSCSADMLGLQPVTLNFLLNHLKCRSWSQTDMKELLRLLAESWRRRAPLLYTNLELLLDKATLITLQKESTSSNSDVQDIKDKNQNMSPNVPVPCVRNISKLSRKKKMVTACDASIYNLSHKPLRTSSVDSSTVRTEQKAAKVVRDSLDALTDFFDLMSFLDSSLPAVQPLVPGSPESAAPFTWTGAEVKDGLLDELSEEERSSWSRERLQLDIQAAIEGLGCRRCWWRACETWTEAQSLKGQLEDKRWRQLKDRLALEGSSKRQSLSFISQPLCAPSASQRRYKLSRTVLSSKYFSMLGDREAVALDYAPILRSIRHHEEAGRFSNYLSREHLGISKAAMQLLAEDFP